MADLKEILELDLKGNPMIYIIGKAGAGKTHLSNLMKYMGRVIHTDDYIKYPELLVCDIKFLSKHGVGVIVEGMMCYELFVLTIENALMRPDLIIDVQISRAKQEEIYRNERDPDKIKYQKRFYEKCLGMYNEYFRLMENKTMPKIVNFENNW